TTVFDGDRAIGLTGASIDLSSFLKTFAGEREPGVTPIIFDGDGAIQAHPDTARITFNAALGDTDASTSIFGMVEATPRSHLQAAMQRAQAAPNDVQSLALAFNGRPQLLSMAYLPALDWYALTAVDLKTAHIVEPRWLWLATISVILLIAALLAGFGYGVERIVLRPLRRLQQSARAM